MQIEVHDRNEPLLWVSIEEGECPFMFGTKDKAIKGKL